VPGGYLELFTSLARLQQAAMLADKARLLADVLKSCGLFSTATVIVFDPGNPSSDITCGSDFSFRAQTMEVRRLFLHAMERFSVGGAYLVAQKNAAALAAFAR